VKNPLILDVAVYFKEMDSVAFYVEVEMKLSENGCN
jgi:hypothetical protein